MDRVRWYYYFQVGYSQEEESSHESFKDRMAYWKPFEVKAVEKILEDFPDSIIDFGAGHSYFPDAAQFEAVKAILNPIPNIFLLLPSEDREESLRICNERLRVREGNDLEQDKLEANQWFINHPSNFRLSKQTIYTHNDTPEQTARRIIQRLK